MRRARRNRTDRHGGEIERLTLQAPTRLAGGATAYASRAVQRSTPPQWRSIRFRWAPRTYDAPPWGCIVRVVSLTKSRKAPTRKDYRRLPRAGLPADVLGQGGRHHRERRRVRRRVRPCATLCCAVLCCLQTRRVATAGGGCRASARARARTHTRTHAHTHTRARTHTHTHTHTRLPPPHQHRRHHHCPDSNGTVAAFKHTVSAAAACTRRLLAWSRTYSTVCRPSVHAAPADTVVCVWRVGRTDHAYWKRGNVTGWMTYVQ